MSKRFLRDGRADAAPRSWRASSIDSLMFVFGCTSITERSKSCRHSGGERKACFEEKLREVRRQIFLHVDLCKVYT